MEKMREQIQVLLFPIQVLVQVQEVTAHLVVLEPFEFVVQSEE